MTEREKLDAGLEYCLDDPELAEDKLRAVELCRKLGEIEIRDRAGREAVVRELFGAVGEHPQVLDNFRCDNGRNIRAGDNFLANFNVTILDRAKVSFGDNVLLAPGVTITTVNHAMTAHGRREQLCTAKPIVIGNDVWVGANCVILPGVTIGDNVVIAAGAVVNRDVPDDALAAGVPARPVKKLER